MPISRFFGWLFLVLALLAWGAELLRWMESGHYQFVALGEIWFRLDSPSLNLVQAVTQRYIHPFLWDPVIVTVLLSPGWLPPALLSALFLYRGYRSRKRHIFY